MVNLKELKTRIEDGSVSNDGIIFKSKDTFVPMQYINRIATLFNKEVLFVNSIDAISKSTDLFGYDSSNQYLSVLIIDTLDVTVNIDYFCYIICSKCKNNDFVEIPNLDTWQMVDYAVSNSSKQVDFSKLEELVDSCGDMYCLDNELSKFTIFNKSEQSIVLDTLIKSNQIKRSYSSTIFDFTNAVLDKDMAKVRSIYLDISNYDIDPIAVVSIIRKQLRNIVVVGFSKNPTEENTGLSSKQIYWIRRNLNKYTSEYIIKAYTFMCDVDQLLKKGLLSSNQLLDYILVNLL